jgi:hypothetical protein
MNAFENPFAGSSLKVLRAIDESKLSICAMQDKIKSTSIEEENEFYTLFNDCTLVKRTRSKFPTSGYLKGEPRISFTEFYGF